MGFIENKLSKYLKTMDDQAIAGFIREVVFSLPENQRRELIIKHLPEMKTEIEQDEISQEEEDCPVVNIEEPKSRIWTVEVCRTATAFRTLKVIATTEEEACEKAIDAAGDEEFGSGEADYSTPDGAF